MTTTTNLGMTLLEQGQAQKEVTINQALVTMDTALGGSSLAGSLAAHNLDNIGRIGIGTTDTGNKLSVTGNSVLFNTSTGDIRTTLNKTNTSNNALFSFQNGFSTRAEFGLAGNDDFTMKVSPNGSSFNNGIVINATTAAVTFPNTPGFSGATASAAGGKGLVPAPAAGDQTKYLKGDGTWATVSGGGVSDGDKGDITVSGSGTAWNIDDAVITKAKTVNYTANSFWGNPTGSAATPVDVPIQYVAETAYTGTITWTGTAAPSGTTNHTYRWHRIGKMVFLRINLLYATSGTSLTQAVLDFPSGVPAIEAITGYASGDACATCVAQFYANPSSTGNANATRGFIFLGTTNTILLLSGSAGYRAATINITYMTDA